MNYWSVIVVWLLIMMVLVIIMFITKVIIELIDKKEALKGEDINGEKEVKD